jgi:hypothetical protein
VVSDLPSEARMHPSLWGRFNVVKQHDKLKIVAIGSTDSLDLSGEGAGQDEDIEMLLDP